MRSNKKLLELPTAKLKLGESAINIYKYGRAMRPYEALRRMTLDVFNIHLQEIGVQAADNKIAEILTIVKTVTETVTLQQAIKQKTLIAHSLQH